VCEKEVKMYNNNVQHSVYVVSIIILSNKLIGIYICTRVHIYDRYMYRQANSLMYIIQSCKFIERKVIELEQELNNKQLHNITGLKMSMRVRTVGT